MRHGTPLTHPQVFDAASLAPRRTIAATSLSSAYGFTVTSDGRLFVVENNSVLVVLDGASGAELTRMALPGNSHGGVAVTSSGAILVSHFSPNGLVVIDSAS